MAHTVAAPGGGTVAPQVEAFFDPFTSTVTYVVREPDAAACAVIDPVLDYEPKSGRVSTGSVDALAEYLRSNALEVEWILETHAHADHLSGAQYLKERHGGAIAIGERIRDVQARFAPMFDFPRAFTADGSQFDHLFHDGELFSIGRLGCRVMHTPGHTPACVTYLTGDAAFVGDTLFMPDSGTARADFPGGSPRTLYRSIRRILALPPRTRLYLCHDYPPGEREPRWETTVQEQRSGNRMIADGVDEEEFVARREARDAGLGAPLLLLPSLQVNIRAGRLPDEAQNGIRYLRIPLNQFGPSR